VSLLIDVEIPELDGYNEEVHSKKDAVADLLPHCPNVTMLSISTNIYFLFEFVRSSCVDLYNSQIEKLEVSKGIVDDIPFRFTVLREIVCTGNVGYMFDTMLLLESSGCNLEKLVLHGWTSFTSKLWNIKEICPNLKNISMKGWSRSDVDAIWKLLISFGGQLEYACLAGMNEGELGD